MRLFFTQLGYELWKLFARKRTHIGFGVFLVTEVLILSLLHLPKVQRSFTNLLHENGYLWKDFNTGPTVAFLMVSYTVIILGGLYIALIAGDLVAKEVEDGTLRMVLCRPVSRLRLLALKYATCIIYTIVLVFFIFGSSLLLGLLFQGMGKLFVYSPMDGVFGIFEPREGLLRFLAGTGFLAAALLTVSTLGFTLSCLNMKPATATIITLSILFLDSILRTIPFFKSISPYLLSTNIDRWTYFFDDSVSGWSLAASLLFLFAVNGTLLGIAAAAFQDRDFKS